MDDAEVAAEAVVSAGAFVPARAKLPPRALAVGSPDKGIRSLSDEDVARKREGTANYHELARRSLRSLSEVSPLTAVPTNRKRLEFLEVRTMTDRGRHSNKPSN
ncbi:hypothetical protein [Paraburkholderia sp. 32]|uniref:hypothetical protein n=1 Tax=Paraburkholderia sp. 32 TaxID=2991057 RepID=UPI003D190413